MRLLNRVMADTLNAFDELDEQAKQAVIAKIEQSLQAVGLEPVPDKDPATPLALKNLGVFALTLTNARDGLSRDVDAKRIAWEEAVATLATADAELAELTGVMESWEWVEKK
jgi:hypothetical protein